MLRHLHPRPPAGPAARFLPPGSRLAARRAPVAARRVGVLAVLLVLSACRGGFRVDQFGGDHTKLYDAGVRELQLRHWGNAVVAFEKLSTDLPARDTLLPQVQYNLGRAHSGNADHLLAAQAFTKVAENFPEDTLADDAMYESAREYQRLWRSPELDSQYGTTSQATFRTLIAVYPDSPRKKDAERELGNLEEMFATKEYMAGYYYFRRKAYDPAILYFKTVVNSYPETARTRDAWLRMVESYRVIQYKEEAAEACASARKRFANDPEVRALCPPSAAKPDSAAVATPDRKP